MEVDEDMNDIVLQDIQEPVAAQFEKLPLGMQMRMAAGVIDKAYRLFPTTANAASIEMIIGWLNSWSVEVDTRITEFRAGEHALSRLVRYNVDGDEADLESAEESVRILAQIKGVEFADLWQEFKSKAQE